ncbi:MBL fold metallo-hydrolase [Desulfobacula sp.]|uniref:MBL fold metallo-hydrolase n=1 Tax=Desulfobacula sp. TaxID=2593537 RepID=UPI001EB9F22D|nr:MBL fold metallo-hydrolase [Desulfobacula sp.]
MSLTMRWLGTACFEILLPKGKTLIIDPYVDDSISSPISSDQFLACDYIFITHGHYDHVLDIGKLAQRFSPIIYCSTVAARSLEKHLSVDPKLIRTISAYDKITIEEIIVDVVPGLHVEFDAEYTRLTGKHITPIQKKDNPFTLIKKGLQAMMGTDWLPEKFNEWMVNFPQGEQLNFVFKIPGCPIIYMAGTRPDAKIIDMAKNVNADITLLQVLTANTLTGMEEPTVDLAISSGCSIVVPQHHDRLFKGAIQTDLTKFKQLLAKKSKIQIQEFIPGKWYKFDSLD